MMTIYSILDRRTHSYSAPLVFPNDEVCKRSLVDSMSNSLVKRFPDDFSVYKIGTFDDQQDGLKQPLTACDPDIVFEFSEVFEIE